MSKVSLDELHIIITKPDKECDGYELHLKKCWEYGYNDSIFYLTGLDVSLLNDKPRRNFFNITNPNNHEEW